MNERNIGRVVSVDSFRVLVELDNDLKGLYKSGLHDIYEIARINSYITIPVGAERIVALITRVKTHEEAEFEQSIATITLPQSKRILVATMLGTIGNDRKYTQGVYTFPILDNPVWYITKEDLELIFDSEISQTPNYEEDYYLPIGVSPAFSDFEVRMNPDKFFGKHAAILGNTGSGKSCTVAALLQGLFSHEYSIQGTDALVSKSRLQGAHVVIFDTNGEYHEAFQGTDENKYPDKELVNAITISQAGLSIPYWFMNYADFEHLFEPSAATQAPILKRAIGLARNQVQAEAALLIPQVCINQIEQLMDTLETGKTAVIKRTIYEDVESLRDAYKCCNTCVGPLEMEIEGVSGCEASFTVGIAFVPPLHDKFEKRVWKIKIEVEYEVVIAGVRVKTDAVGGAHYTKFGDPSNCEGDCLEIGLSLNPTARVGSWIEVKAKATYKDMGAHAEGIVQAAFNTGAQITVGFWTGSKQSCQKGFNVIRACLEEGTADFQLELTFGFDLKWVEWNKSFDFHEKFTFWEGNC